MRKLFSIILFIFLCVLPVFSSSSASVRIESEARVENEIILLGNIGQVSGDEVFAERIRKISLGYAPNIGAVREITRARIELAIAAAGFSKTDYSIQAPSIIRIFRAGQQIEPERFRETITKAILSKFNDVEIEFVRIDLPQAFDIPLGEVEFEPKFGGVRNLFAPFSLTVEIRVDKKIFQRISVDVEIQGFAEVFVAARDLPQNQRLTEADVKLKRVRIEKAITSYLRTLDDLRGTKLVKDLTTDAQITSDTFVADVVVKSGDLVRIVGNSGRLKISVNGKAQGSGRIGDRIAVENLQSNKLIQATIVDEGLVKVFL